MGYFRNAVIGFSWMGAFRVISRIGAFARIAILARLLVPAQFGLFGIASIMLILLETLTDTGINIFLIQEKKDLKEYIDTAWIVSIARGTIIAIVLILISSFVAQYFNAPDSKPLIVIISLVAFIKGFINPSRVRFIKDLQFKQEFLISIVIFFTDTLVTIILTFVLQSPIGLVWGLVAGAIIELILSFVFIRPIPKFSLDTVKIKRVISRGKWITGSRIFNYFFEQGGDIVVGKLLNTSSLGVYQVAYKISTLPLTEVTKVVSQVTFPVYTNIADNRERLKKAFFKTTLTIILIVIPIGIVLYAFPNQIVKILLGKEWLEVVPILRILSIFGVIRAIMVSSDPLFNALKKQELVTHITLVNLVVMAVLIVPFTIRWGLYGTVTSVIIGSLFAIPLMFRYLRSLLK